MKTWVDVEQWFPGSLDELLEAVAAYEVVVKIATGDLDHDLPTDRGLEQAQGVALILDDSSAAAVASAFLAVRKKYRVRE